MPPGPSRAAGYPRRLHPGHHHQRGRPARQRPGQSHVAPIQITTYNTVFGGLSGPASTLSASHGARKQPRAGTSWVLTDLTIALPLLCQGLAEAYGPDHVRPARAAIAVDQHG